MHYAPCFVIPGGLSTLYRYSLTTVAQDKPHHEKPLIRDCFNHKGSCTLFKPYLTIAAGISSSSFVRVSTRQLAVSSLSKGISSTIFFFTRALVLTGPAHSLTLSQFSVCLLASLFNGVKKWDNPIHGYSLHLKQSASEVSNWTFYLYSDLYYKDPLNQYKERGFKWLNSLLSATCIKSTPKKLEGNFNVITTHQKITQKQVGSRSVGSQNVLYPVTQHRILNSAKKHEPQDF